MRTALATHVLGAIVNIGAVGIVADHLRGRSALRLADAALVSRSFSAAAFWSPFWAAAAAATTLVPGANSLVLSARYGIDSVTLTRRNLIYLRVVLVASWPALLLCAALV